MEEDLVVKSVKEDLEDYLKYDGYPPYLIIGTRIIDDALVGLFILLESNLATIEHLDSLKSTSKREIFLQSKAVQRTITEISISIFWRIKQVCKFRRVYRPSRFIDVMEKHHGSVHTWLKNCRDNRE